MAYPRFDFCAVNEAAPGSQLLTVRGICISVGAVNL